MVFEESASIMGDESKEVVSWHMTLYDQYTSLDGRINVLRFFCLYLAIGIPFFIISLLPSALLSLFLSLPLYYCIYALIIKRLQDTGRGYWWKQYAKIGVFLSILSSLYGLILMADLLDTFIEPSSTDSVIKFYFYLTTLISVHIMIVTLFFSAEFRANTYGPEDPFLKRIVRLIPLVYSYRDFSKIYVLSVSAVYLFWLYCKKFLGMSVDYLSTMTRDITIAGNQMNTSYYPIDKLTIAIGGVILICFLLVQNDFPTFVRQFKRRDVNVTTRLKSSITECSVSIFAIICFIISYILLTSVLELSPGSQTPFFFFGSAIVGGIILLQDNLNKILSWSWIRSIDYNFLFARDNLSLVVPVSSIIVFIALTLNLSLIPVISQDIPQFLSLIILITTIYWSWRISKEDMKPTLQSKRTAALAYLVFLPFILYLLLRVLYLQHDPNPVMQNRWAVQFDFMDKVNTFKINPWPIEVSANADARWLFLKAAIINSVRVTLLSIVLCLILGIIIGVTRLSTNKLASTMATVYVEIFRNLPLAVLLFLIATQFGIQAPLFIEERFLLGGAVFYSNQGIWFVTVASYHRLVMGLTFLALLRVALRFIDRIEPRNVMSPGTLSEHFRRPFSTLGWRIEVLVADLLLVLSALIFIDYLVPFVSTHGGGTEAFIAMALLVYALSITSKIDDDGVNSLQIDDSESGLRKRFTIWVAGISIALGIALSKGLSWPEYVKDWNGDGVIDSPGSWDIAAGSGFEITPFFLAMMLGLTLFTASTVAEIVRGSIQSLPRGQVEAAISLSLNPYQRLRLVILPQALRSMVPLLNNQFMNVWKNSSLAVIVAYSDIFYVVLVMMNNVGKLIPLFLLLLFTYQVGSLAISAVMNWYNSRVTMVKI